MKEQGEILVDDDEKEIRSLLGLMLKNRGYTNITFACDGLGAIDVMQQKSLDLAFLDINMPGIDGISVLKHGMELNASCFYVIVSAQSDLHSVKDVIKAGARGFIVKPFTERKVVDLLGKFEQTYVDAAQSFEALFKSGAI